MQYMITTAGAVDFAPSSEIAEIIQNVRTIITTRIGSVPLDRNFGVAWDFIDQPLALAKMQLRVLVIDAIEKYEPRAKVEAVEFEENEDLAMEGVLLPRVIISIGDEGEEE